MVKAREDLLFGVDQLALSITGEVLDHSIYDAHVNTVILHQFFYLWHLPEQVSHLLHAHIISACPSFLGACYCGLYFTLNLLLHESQVLVSKSDPQIILVIEVDSTTICSLDLAVFTNILLIVSIGLIIEIVYNWSNDIEAAVQKKKRCSWFSWSYLLVSPVELFQVLMELLCKILGYLAAAQILYIWQFIINCAYC